MSKKHPKEELNRLEFGEIDFLKILDYIPSMGPETISRVRPAFERLQEIMFADIPTEAGVYHSEVRLNEREFFSVHLYINPTPSACAISCGLYQANKATLAFRIVREGSQSGLSLIESGGFGVSFGGSPRIKVEGRVVIGNRGDDRADLIGDAFDQKGFQGLADHVVDWVERAVKEGKAGEIPFSLSNSSQ